MIFSPLSEIEFFERSFGIAQEHDPDEGVFSYVRSYEDGSELVVTFEIGADSTAYARISRAGHIVSEVTAEGVTGASFQSWEKARVLRLNFSGARMNMDMRVNFHPHAGIHMASLSSGA